MNDFEHAMREKDFIGAHAALEAAELDDAERTAFHAVVFVYEDRLIEARDYARRAAATESRFAQLLAAWTLAKLDDAAAAQAILDRLTTDWVVSPYLTWLQCWLDWSEGGDEGIDDNRDAVGWFGLDKLANRFPDTEVEAPLRSLPDQTRFRFGAWRDLRAEFAWTDNPQLHIPIALDIMPLNKYLPFHVARMPLPLQALVWASQALSHFLDEGIDWLHALWVAPLALTYLSAGWPPWAKALFAPLVVLPPVAFVSMIPTMDCLTHWVLSLYPTTRRRLYLHARHEGLFIWLLLAEMTVAAGLWIAGWSNRSLGVGLAVALLTALAADRFGRLTQHSPRYSLRATLGLALLFAGFGLFLFVPDLLRLFLSAAQVNNTLAWARRIALVALLSWLAWSLIKARKRGDSDE